MPKVHVVWSDTDEYIVGVFEDETMAGEMAAYSGGKVYEFELNALHAQYSAGYRPWFVCISEGGKVVHAKESPHSWIRARDGGSFREWRLDPQQPGQRVHQWYVWVLAKGQEQAVELAKGVVGHG